MYIRLLALRGLNSRKRLQEKGLERPLLSFRTG